MFNRHINTQTAFLDLLFNTLVGYVFLFVMAFLLINPITENNNVRSNAQFIINITWPDANPDDVDVWLEDPTGNTLWFRQKDIGLMHLDRDDLGSSGDSITLGDGTTITSTKNQEIVTIRGFIAGEWTLNIHMYKKNCKKPTPVTVIMSRINPSVQVLVNKVIILKELWEEVTITRFTMKRDGTIFKWDTLKKNLVQGKSAGDLPMPETGRPVNPDGLGGL